MQPHIEKRLGIIFVISCLIFLLEITGGIISNSLALISDSLHILLDISALGISMLAFRLAKRPHSKTLTYGFHRAEIIAAFINGVSLIGLTLFIFYEAYHRIFQPPQIQIDSLIGFTLAGLSANIVMVLLLKKESRSNLNVKGAYFHVLGDTVSSMGVLGGGILMYLLGSFVIDVIVSVGIGVLIMRSGIILCRECLHIFMEGTPHEIKLANVAEEIEKFPEVAEMHDLHVWTLTSNVFAMSAHVKIKQEFSAQWSQLVSKINETMRDKFGINHCTIQIENEYDLVHPDK